MEDYRVPNSGEGFCREEYPSSGLLYLRFLLLRRRLHIPRSPLDPRTQPSQHVLRIRQGLGLPPPAAASSVLARGGKVAEALSGDNLLALEESGKYSEIIHYPFELWEGEATYCSSPAAAYFDWGTVLSTLGRTVPPYMAPANPAAAKLHPSFVRIPEHLQQTNIVGKGQEALPPHTSPNIDRYTAVLDPFGFPLSPLCLANAEMSKVASEHGSSSPFPSGSASSSQLNLALGGRGVLGSWGPNIAADAIVMRKHPETKRLQVALIQRSDGSQAYALPGGFADPDEVEHLSRCAAREFLEEAAAYAVSPPKKQTTKRSPTEHASRRAAPGASRATGQAAQEPGEATQASETQAESLAALKDIFGRFKSLPDGQFEFEYPPARQPICVYAGLVDDERNTDNAWMETAAFLWVLDQQQSGKVILQAGSDAVKGSAAFYDVEDDPQLSRLGVRPLENLFSSHSMLLRRALNLFTVD